MSATDPSVPIDVDVTRSTSGVWLVKMPKYLSQILNEYSDGSINGEIGRLVRRPAVLTGKGSTSAAAGVRTQDVFFCLNDQIMDKIKEKSQSKDEQLPPREHRFCLSNISDGVLRTVYTRTATPNSPLNEQIAVVGKVMQRAEVRPVENEQYMSMKRKQFETSQEPTRKAQMITKKTNVYAPKRDHEANKQREREKKLMGKRVRSSEETVLNLMFGAFAKNQYISMSSLETITQQPKNYLQQLVKKYCNYNNAGHNYELKPQFRYYSAPKEDGDDIEDDDDDDDDDDDNNNNNNANT
ncbi:unnamed protein product [Rotaria magnacalcarata]|uniref:General transcription factor IIF subunit 2 n=1 Tax=Rotaria magnacalcarata TaxID=392030 RepID=A0A820DK34_9BILA|nr:unnamed protein product [Rotaria magnacalcarata]CAF2114874.1 unnamed protein product [Rotaria magnacalcarata]CAF2163540.1 unnamed protein product [Rotaria magnacalcarata]CAF4029646.1 unnamed protein product [Rotaria magnacalcarata]CAF4078546.1 unnamed protein product [Rotaria magnacalcarata]